MTTTQVAGMSLQLGNAPDKGVMIVHLTMTIPLLDLIAVIPDDVEHLEARRREPADATEQLFWKQVSAVPEASCRTPTYAEWCLGKTHVHVTPDHCTISLGGATDTPVIAVNQGFQINAWQLIGVIIAEHARREEEGDAPEHAPVQAKQHLVSVDPLYR